MSTTISPHREQRLGELYDYGVARPQGFTKDEACFELGWTHRTFGVATHDLRHTLGVDSINLVWDYVKDRGHVYTLVGTHEQAVGWEDNRLRDLRSRLETILSVATSIANGADKRTKAGRISLLVVKFVSRLLEDMKEIEQVT